MTRRLITLLALSAAMAVGTLSNTATAQWEDPEGGDTGGNWQPPPEGEQPAEAAPPAQGWQAPPAQASATEPPPGWGGEAEAPPSESSRPSDTDHGAVSDAFGVGFLGTTGAPVAIANGAGFELGHRQVPMIGARKWFSEGWGLDLGFGIWQASDSVELNGATGDMNLTLLAVRLGLPLNLTATKHFSIHAVPSAEITWAKGDMPNADNATFDQTLVSGLGIRVATAIQAETQFGFIGIPNLSIMASVGLALSIESGESSVCTAADCGTESVTTLKRMAVEVPFSDRIQDSFLGALSAMYYF